MNRTKIPPALYLCLYLLILPNCRQERVVFSPLALPSQILLGFTLDESVSGRRLWTLYASRAVVWEKDERIDVDTVKIVFYDENGAPYSQLTADCGRVFTRTEDLVASGNVCVVTADSTTLFTDSLAWNNSRRIVHTDADITIRTLKGTILGKGLISDASLQRIEIKSEVRGSADYDFHH